MFLGTIAPNSPLAKLKRAADSQICVRAGGKHKYVPFLCHHRASNTNTNQ